MRRLLPLLSLFLACSLELSAQMSGNYTIDPLSGASNNFISFSDAANGLSTVGISGNVVLTAAPGVYVETPNFETIPGAGPAATVTVQSSTGNPQDVIISCEDQLSSGVGAVNFNGAGYISFDGISIRNFLGGFIFSSTAAVHIRDNSEHLSFNNCEFIVDSTSSSPAGYAANARFGVVVSNNGNFGGTASQIAGHDLSFTGCMFRGGAVGLVARGVSYAMPANSLVIDDCDFAKQISGLVELRYFTNASITNSRFAQMRTAFPATVLNGNGLRLLYSWDLTIASNSIVSERVPLLIEHAATTSPAVFNNTMVYNNYLLSYSTTIGYFVNSINTSFYHNTFKTYIGNVGGVSFAGTATDIDFSNNMVQGGFDAGSYSFTGPSSYTGTIDNNLYYGGAGQFSFGTVYNTLNDWKAAYPMFNAASVYADSVLLEEQTPIIMLAAGNYSGANNLGINTDIYGTGRCNPPSIGAYEFVTPACIPLSVRLLDISAATAGNDVVLKWHTAEESALKHFEVEYSLDGKIFQTAGVVSPDGIAGGGYYSFRHAEASRLAGTSRMSYRLRMVDLSGTYEYSKLVYAQFGKQLPGISIYPNPFIETINISLSGAEGSTYAYTLSDISGKRVRTGNGTLSGSADFTIGDLKTIQHGTYFLTLEIGSEKYTVTLTK